MMDNNQGRGPQGLALRTNLCGLGFGLKNTWPQAR